MLPEDSLKDLLSQDLNNRDKLLICLAVDPIGPRQVKDLAAIARSAGWRIKSTNFSVYLQRAQGLAIRTGDGWELTSAGMQKVAAIAGPLVAAPVQKVASSLRATLTKISDPDTASFVEEAIACYEGRQYRAAVVLSWVGAVSVLQNHIASNRPRLAAFNAEAVPLFASSRKPFVAARNADDLGQLQESAFLTVLQKIGTINKNTKQQLERCLELRNACGHPNSYRLGPAKVTAHIEDLMLNVFSRFC